MSRYAYVRTDVRMPPKDDGDIKFDHCFIHADSIEDAYRRGGHKMGSTRVGGEIENSYAFPLPDSQAFDLIYALKAALDRCATCRSIPQEAPCEPCAHAKALIRKTTNG